jgi:hypothetical protein
LPDYQEFRLTIRGPTDGRYTVVASGPGDPVQGEFVPPFNDDQLKLFVLTLGRSGRGTRSFESTDTVSAREFGAKLFEAVMAGDVGQAYHDAQRQNPALRLTLSLGEARALADVPWEFLYDKSAFVATSPDTPIVRTLEAPHPPRPLKVELPLRILVVSCQPKDAEFINAGVERANLEPALKPLADRNAVVLDWLEHATLGALNDKLRDGGYHVIHFIGHGRFAPGLQDGALIFENEEGFADPVGADRFAQTLYARDTIRLVVLNSCEGARSSKEDAFSGVAGSLIEKGFPAIIGMQFEISDLAAIRFAKYFYLVLAEGEPVDRAVSEARLAMFASRDDTEWGTPVLFMRVPDGHLFAISNAVPIPRAILEEPEETEAEPQEVEQTPGPLERLRQALAGVPRKAWLGLGAAAGVLGIVALAFVLLLSPHASIRVVQGPVPGSITIEGDGFRASEAVVIRVMGRNITTAAHPDGTVSLPVDVGEGAAGVVLAEGQISHLQATTQFQLPVPSAGIAESPSLAPSPSLPGESPSLTPTLAPTLSCFDPARRANLIVFYSDHNDAITQTAAYAMYCIDPASGEIGSIRPDAVKAASTPEWFVGWAPSHDQMVYTLGGQGDRDVFSLGEDRRPVEVSTGPDDDWFPAWAPNDVIAFIRTGKADSTVMRVARGSQPEPWFSGRKISSIAWSPKEPFLAFFAYRDPDGFRSNDFDIGVVPFDGTSVNWIITNESNDMNPTWSTDGQTIAFVRGDPGRSATNDIWTYDMRSGRQVQLTGIDIDGDGPVDDGNDVQDGNPVWSPDGQQIAFYRRSVGGYQIWVMNRDGSDPRNLMPGQQGRNLDPNWR